MGKKTLVREDFHINPLTTKERIDTLKLIKNEEATFWEFRDIGQDLTENPPLSDKIHLETLIVSDTHIGADKCRARALLATLNTFHFKRIVLLGDIFDDLDFEYLPDSHWDVIERIRGVEERTRESKSTPKNTTEEVWIRGNHDQDIIKVMKRLIGINVYEEYFWEQDGKTYLAIHGDQFDLFMKKFPGLTKYLVMVHNLLQKIDPQNRHLIKYVSKRIVDLRRESHHVAEGASWYGLNNEKKKVDFVLCGHTHAPMRKKYDHLPGVEYINSGSWVENPSSFITVTDEGPKLNFVKIVTPTSFT